ncbi:MAG: DUF2924 domain-containing protein [Deltaproteobacteria bacterium]|nr:MAG: DUF2924 domain-containing protein [Deltaproteobacteria bacterium]
MTGKQSEGAKTRREIADLTQQLAALREMTVNELREKYRDVFGEPSRSRNKDYLRKKVGWRIQELAEGGLSDRASSKIEALTADEPLRWRKRRRLTEPTAHATASDATAATTRDPRLPEPGTVLTREHDGVEHTVTVLDGGFEYEGQRFKSLSKVARVITGTNWNGFLFFGLKRRTPGGGTT